MSHTPTPWRVETNAEYVDLDEGEELIVYSIVGPGPQEKSIVVTDSGYYGPSTEDAQFIIKAVNSHQAMKEAIRDMKAIMLVHQVVHSEGCGRAFEEVIKRANKALTLANGEDKEP